VHHQELFIQLRPTNLNNPPYETTILFYNYCNAQATYCITRNYPFSWDQTIWKIHHTRPRFCFTIRLSDTFRLTMCSSHQSANLPNLWYFSFLYLFTWLIWGHHHVEDLPIEFSEITGFWNCFNEQRTDKNWNTESNGDKNTHAWINKSVPI